MNLKVFVFVALVTTVGVSKFAAASEEHRFIIDNSMLPAYASYPTQTFRFPAFYGKLFLANTAAEVVYTSYPNYASYPDYASYPSYASYPNPLKAFEDRAQLVCQFMNFSRARYASSQDAAVPANLITVGYDENGELFASTRDFQSVGTTLPTFIDTLECVK